MRKKQLIQLGGELKREREARNITLEDIARRTRINLEFLKAMEAGQFNFLPGTYVRYFLKSYLRVLGGNMDKYLRSYDEIIRVPTHPIIFEKQPEIKSTALEQLQKIIKQHFSTFVISASLIILVIFMVIFNSTSETPYLTNEEINNQITEQDSQLASFSSFLSTRKKLKLNLVAQDRTWLQLVIDDSIAQEYIFERGDSITWLAKEKFFLRIGNAAGVRLYLNGNDVGLLGKRMEVVKLLLTKDSIQQSNF